MSNTAIVKNIQKPCLSFKAQTFATVFAIISAVVLPQIFHLLGDASGLGTIPGDIFLPMHLPIILVGLLAGPYAGAISGLLAPIVSFSLSGMPNITILPLMMVELFAYGLCSGMLRNRKMPTIAKVFITQIAGRAAYLLAILASIYIIGNSNLHVAAVLSSMRAGIFGIVLQLILFPLIVYRIENSSTTKLTR